MTVFYRLLTSVCLAVCLTSLSTAMLSAQDFDIEIDAITSPLDGAVINAGFSTEITLTLHNNGPDICPFSILELSITNGDGETVFGPQAHLVGSLGPGESMDVSVGSWTPNQTGEMTIDAMNTTPDLVPDNDAVSSTVIVDEAIIPQDEAIAEVLDYLSATNPYYEGLVAFLFNKDEKNVVQPVGTTFSDYGNTFTNQLSTKSYFFWTDNTPENEWTHPSSFLWYNAWTGEISEQESEYWPFIDGSEYTGFMTAGNSSSELIYGTYATHAPDNVTYAAQTQPGTTTWALIVTGDNLTGSGERKARENDIKRIKNYLNNNPRGPQIPDGNIKVASGTNTGGATKQQVCDSLDAFEGCDKLYFFYGGHGSKDGKAVLEGGDMSWEELACKLLDNGAKEVCVTIEACHSGTAIPALRDKRGPNGEQLKGEFVVSSSAALETKRDDNCGTPFYKGLEKCSNDISADRDGNGKITPREAFIWAAETDPCVGDRDPQWGTIDDDEVITFYRKLKPKNKVKKDGIHFYLCTTCFIRETYSTTDSDSDGDGGGEGGGEQTVEKETFWETRVYALSKGRNRTPKKAIVVYCGKDSIATFNKPLTGNKPLCFATLDKPCKKGLRLRYVQNSIVKGGSDRIQLDFEDGITTVEYRTRTYDPGEHIFHSFPIEAATGNTIVSSVDAVPGWGLTVAPVTMAAAGVINPVEMFLTGDVPTTAVYGAGIFAEVRDTTEDDTSHIYLDALLRRTQNNDLDDGKIASYNELNLYGGINAYLGLVDITESSIHIKTATTCTIGASGSLTTYNTSIDSEIGIDYSFVVNGSINWQASSLVRPLDGLELNGASGLIDGGGIHDSKGDGLRLNGNFALMDFNSVEITNSAQDGLVADAAFNLVVEGADIDNSGGNDVVLVNSSIVTMLDSYYDAAKETADVNSILVRNWTTSFIVQNQDGEPLTNANVTIQDAFGSTVAVLTVDVDGNTSNVELTEYGRIGNTFYNFTPHNLTVTFGTTAHVEAYTADDYGPHQIVLTTPLITDAPERERPTSLSPEIEVYPNPAGDRVHLSFELEHAAEAQYMVVDAHGRIVDAQRLTRLQAGPNTLVFDSSRWSSGTYYCIVHAGASEAIARIRIVR